VEKIRAINVLKVNAALLRRVCSEYQFDLDNKFGDEYDQKTSLTKYQANRPKEWEDLFCGLMPTHETSVGVQMKGDAIFLIMYFVVPGGSGKTSLYVRTAQSVHETCRSTSFITSLNLLSLLSAK
jgi:hypothetical protein